MASQLTARYRSRQPVRNGFLSQWFTKVRWHSSRTWRMFSCSSSTARPTDKADTAWNKSVTDHDFDWHAGSNLNPDTPRNLMIFYRNCFHTLRLLRFLSRSRRHERARPAEGKAE